jgi:hypothetical protein
MARPTRTRPFASRSIGVLQTEVRRSRSKSRPKLATPPRFQVVRPEREAEVRKALIHILIFVAVLVAIIALGIWFNLGPVVHSAVA